MKYLITLPTSWEVYYEIEANSPQEAIAKIQNGDVEIEDHEFSIHYDDIVKGNVFNWMRNSPDVRDEEWNSYNIL